MAAKLWWMRSGSFLLLTLWAGSVASANAPAAKKAAPILALSLRVTPSKIVLTSPYAENRVLVEAQTGAKTALDMSGSAKLSIADPKIATVDEDGTVRAQHDGSTNLLVRCAGKEQRIPVVVSGVKKAAPPRFVTDVIPVLTKTGCNMGACHGAGSGKGGFKLSLRGYDPDADYEVITRGSRARRISPSQPDNSLLLRKPTMGVAHRGGLRFKVGSPEYRLLRDWIVGGMPGPQPTEPKVTRLEVVPPVRTLALGQTQRFLVRAYYSDKTQRDVTGQAVFAASEETVASVTPDGEAKATGFGEGAVLVRYQSLVATARVISPFASPRPLPAAAPDKIDLLVNQKLAGLGLEPSPRSTDTDFLRRVTLDVIGLLPTSDAVRKFLADRDPKKREKLIDALLARPEYVDYWTQRWGDILRSSRDKVSEKGMYAYNNYIRQSVAENKPWNKFAHDLLVAQGSGFEKGEANFYRTAGTPGEFAEATSQIFLGVRIQCAKCHNHPYDRWTQDQYYQMAAFFSRVKSKNGDRASERVVYISDSGEVTHPKTKKEVAPVTLDATPVPADFQGDRRQALADWITSEKNPFFSRILVNRVWRHFMGRGLVEPVDDLRLTNPPSNAPLFDWLAQDFARNGYDVKRLMRTIMLSQAYQRSAEPTKANARDTRFYSHFLFKRLGAEQLLDAIASATGVSEKFGGFPMGTRATQLPDAGVPSYFLDLFGRPARNVTCECERIDEPNLGQILHLMNNAGLNGRISDKNGRVATLLAAKLPDTKLVEELYLASVSRLPDKEESRKAAAALTTAKSRPQTAEDLLWVLMNSKEFLFNH